MVLALTTVITVDFMEAVALPATRLSTADSVDPALLIGGGVKK